MSNPGANRWGKNLFWQHMWLSDRNYTSILHQNKLFTQLLYIYLSYGILPFVHPFINRRWTPSMGGDVRDFRHNHTARYYRVMYFKDVLNDTEITYFDRTKNKVFYATRIWVLRYQNWLVLNFFYFQPLKGTKFKKHKYTRAKDLNFFSPGRVPKIFHGQRLKFILYYYLLNFQKIPNNYYQF